MTDSVKVERRRSARYDARLNLNVHLDLPGDDGEVGDVETLNVSSSGLYFRTERFIEPMTKLALSFDVPVSQEDEPRMEAVNCEGIVVRVLPEELTEPHEAFEVAVFFTTIDAESLHHLEDYLANVLLA